MTMPAIPPPESTLPSLIGAAPVEFVGTGDAVDVKRGGKEVVGGNRTPLHFARSVRKQQLSVALGDEEEQ